MNDESDQIQPSIKGVQLADAEEFFCNFCGKAAKE